MANAARAGEVWNRVVTKSSVAAVLKETVGIYQRLKMERIVEVNTAQNAALAQQLHGALLYSKEMEEDKAKMHENYKYAEIMKQLNNVRQVQRQLGPVLQRVARSLFGGGVQNDGGGDRGPL